MLSKVLLTLAVSFLITQVVSDSQGVPLASPQQQSQQHQQTAAALAQNARKIRLLNSMNPGVIKLYRLLGGGALRQSLDEDDSLLFPDDESYFQKRQYDDYGHMRFGKRNPKDFDDYGHMRFGKK